MGQTLSPGRFITFEGGEGAGKTTQAERLAVALRQSGHDVLTTREPGGSPDAEKIRALVLAERWDAESEALLMVAARRSHLVATIWPALALGRIVLCDRFADSTEAYQGAGRGLPRERLDELHRFIAGDFKPALTLILDIAATDGLARAMARGDATRFERMDLSFHERLRQGFLAIAAREPQRCAVINASATPDEVANAIRNVVTQRLGI